MKLLLIDNYDSFTYLLAQYFEELDCSVTVVNDQDKMSQKIRISPDFICENYDAITISPGPKTPKEAVFSRDVVQLYAGKIASCAKPAPKGKPAGKACSTSPPPILIFRWTRTPTGWFSSAARRTAT